MSSFPSAPKASKAGGNGAGVAGIPYLVGAVQSEYDTDTSMVLNIPSEAAEGDLLVLVGFGRSVITSPTTGWDVHSDLVETGASEVGQRLYVATQTYDGVASTVTFTQTSNDRMGVCLGVFRKSGGTPVVSNVSTDELAYKTVAEHKYDLPEETNPTGGYATIIQALTHSFTHNSIDTEGTNHSIVQGPAYSFHREAPSTDYTAGVSTFSQCRMAALARTIAPGEAQTNTIKFSSISPRTEPTIPYCVMYLT